VDEGRTISIRKDLNGSTAIDRRAALAKLGLGMAAVYAAPVMLRLSEARAASNGSGGGESSGGGEGSGGSSGGGNSADGGVSAGAATSPTGPSSQS